MSTSPSSGTWSEDPDLVPWLLGIHFHRPRYPGRFLLGLCSAARSADPIQYAALRPLLVSMHETHPEFYWESSKTKTSERASK
jgi:hypothetical protein